MFSSLLHSKGTTKQTDGQLDKEARGAEQGTGAQRQDFRPHSRWCATQVLSLTENLPEPHTSEIFMEASSQIHDPSSPPPAAPPPSLEDWRGGCLKIPSFKPWPGLSGAPVPPRVTSSEQKTPHLPGNPKGLSSLGPGTGGQRTNTPTRMLPVTCRSGNDKGSRSSGAGAGAGRLTSHLHGVQPHRDGTGDKGHLDEEPA